MEEPFENGVMFRYANQPEGNEGSVVADAERTVEWRDAPKAWGFLQKMCCYSCESKKEAEPWARF